MSGFREQGAGRARRRDWKAGRGRYLMAIVAVGLGGVLSLTLAPRALSGAATVSAAATPSAAPSTAPTATPNDDGVTWNPDGAVTQVNDGTGDCEIDMEGTVSAPDSSVITAIQATLSDEPVVKVDSDGIDSLASYAFPVAAGATSVKVRAGASVDCSLVNQTDAYLKKTGGGSLGHAVGLVLDSYLRPGKSSQLTAQRAYAALPEWARSALGAIAGATTFVAVSVISVAAAVALGAATTASGGLASPALVAVAGCIGGATSTAVSLLIAGATTSPLSGIVSGLVGCATGTLFPLLPPGTAGTWLGEGLKSALGAEPARVCGQAIVQDAAAADVTLTPISYALQQAAAALERPRP